VADNLAPHSDLVGIISEGINNNYADFNQIDREEASEIGWIIANTLCHELNLSPEADLEKPIAEIL
jgi:hypothetical protein